MAKILVHITHGPEHPTRAALAFHVAKAALDEGHEVTMMLAGDGVQLYCSSSSRIKVKFNSVSAAGW